MIGLLLLLLGCYNLAADSSSEYNTLISCYSGQDKYLLCSGVVSTDILSGYIYIEHNVYENEDVSFVNICGADLSLKSENTMNNIMASLYTDNNLACTTFDSYDKNWDFKEGLLFYIEWQNLNISIDIPSCPYDAASCSFNAYGNIYSSI